MLDQPWLGENELGIADSNLPIGENLSAQSPIAFEEFFRAGGNGLVQPIAWPAMRGSAEANTLDRKVLADQIV
jgi:hypothetical protein